MQTYTFFNMSVCIYPCTRLCMCTCLYVYIHTHIHVKKRTCTHHAGPVCHMDPSQLNPPGIWLYREGRRPELLDLNLSQASNVPPLVTDNESDLSSYFIPLPLATRVHRAFSSLIPGSRQSSTQSPPPQNTTGLQEGLESSGCYLMTPNSQPQFLSFSGVLPAQGVQRQHGMDHCLGELEKYVLSPEQSIAAISIINSIVQQSRSATGA